MFSEWMEAGSDLPHHFLQQDDGEAFHAGEYVEFEDGTYIVEDGYDVWPEESAEHDPQDHLIHLEDQSNEPSYEQKVQHTFQVKREPDDDASQPIFVGHFDDEEDNFYHYSNEDFVYEGDYEGISFVDVPYPNPSTSHYRHRTEAECQFCGARIKHPSKIQAHLRTHTGEKPYECDICQTKFTQKTPWVNHMRKHAGDLPYECSYGCGKRFVNNARKNAHELRHRGLKRIGPPRPHLKPPKRRLPNVERERAAVERSKHSNVQLPEERCPILEWEQSNPEFHQPISAAASKRIDEVIEAVAAGVSLTRKKQYKHRSAIIAQCHICGLMLKHPSKIQAHMRTHTGEKPFSCQFCSLNFSNMYALKMHVKRKHDTGGRDITCRWDCGMKFVSAGARNEHERVVHSGIKRYECTALGCRRMFTRRHYLMVHRQKEHGLYTPIFDPNEVRQADDVQQDPEDMEQYEEVAFNDEEFIEERVIEVDENGVVIVPEGSHILEAEYIDEGDTVIQDEEVFMEYPDLEEAEYVEPLVIEEYYEAPPCLEAKIEESQDIIADRKVDNVQETVNQVWMGNDTASRRCVSVRILKKGGQYARPKVENNS